MMTQFGYGSRCERGASVEERLVCPAALRCNRGASSGVHALLRALMPDQIRTFTAPARLRWQVQPAPKKSIAASAGPTDAHPLAVVP